MATSAHQIVPIFQALGVSDPEGWAHSEASEGIDQTARATVLRALADCVVEACSAESWRTSSRSAEAALDVLVQQGADIEAVKELCIQSTYSAIWNFLRLSSGVDESKLNPANVAWAIVKVDSEGNPVGGIPALYESWWGVLCDVLGRDPSHD
jgi:hypothetical protein